MPVKGNIFNKIGNIIFSRIKVNQQHNVPDHCHTMKCHSQVSCRISWNLKSQDRTELRPRAAKILKERVEKTLRDSLMHLRKKAGLRTTMNFQVKDVRCSLCYSPTG